MTNPAPTPSQLLTLQKLESGVSGGLGLVWTVRGSGAWGRVGRTGLLPPSAPKVNSLSIWALPGAATRGHSSPEAARVEAVLPQVVEEGSQESGEDGQNGG